MIPVRPALPVLRERSDRLLQFLTGQKEFWDYSVDKMEFVMYDKNVNKKKDQWCGHWPSVSFVDIWSLFCPYGLFLVLHTSGDCGIRSTAARWTWLQPLDQWYWSSWSKFTFRVKKSTILNHLLHDQILLVEARTWLAAHICLGWR